MAERLVVGADGGNSKTDLVLADTSGRVWARVRGAGTRPMQDGMAETAARLHALVGTARSQAAAAGLSSDAPIEVGAFYLANLDTEPAEAVMHKELAALGVAARLVVRNDTFAVLGAGRAGRGGVGVVGGAGINAVGVHPDGRVARFLALGPHTGDWGGGRSLGMAALGAAVRAGDGRGPASMLREAVAAHFGRASPEEVALAVEERHLTWREIITLTPVLYAVAEAGDAAALSIVDRMADEVATMATALLNRLDLGHATVPVVLGGGALQNAPERLIRRVRENVAASAPRSRVVVLDVPPVAGPLVDALALAAASAEAVERARADLAGRPSPAS
ncbi:ATPase [Actinoplanes sp. KI2]|uniref:N-acetylglucosamine kinase n=1 Tax=Actinoplanes sp. KI2 TaxID=2983315 RepID=UPI0021D5FDDD|nr:BadF/BadG/BcrA/BcrD ATPase family protein [Actinoplanes sp. KI2]MCU7725400.1 ATPase [Actinoplanes sp. KI2]